MEEDRSKPRRESAATYQRRRLTVGAAALVVLVVALVLVTRIGADAEADLTADDAPTGTTPGPDGSDPPRDDTPADAAAEPGRAATASSQVGGASPSASSTAPSTSLVIPGFSSPQAYLACVKERESRGDYTAVSPDGMFFGAYQIDQVTWDNTAEHAGLTHLYKVQPDYALPADQDTLALALLEWQGTSPWAGDC